MTPSAGSRRKAKCSPAQLEDARRLKEIWDDERLKRRFTQERAASAMGYSSQGTVSQYLLGTIPLNLEAALKFAEFLNVPVSRFSPALGVLVESYTKRFPGQTGRSVKKSSHSDSDALKDEAEFTGRVQTTGISVVGDTISGPSTAWVEAGKPSVWGQLFVTHAASAGRCYALRVVGKELAPRMREGDCIVCDPDVKPSPGDEVMVIVAETGACIIRQLIFQRGGETCLETLDGRDRTVRASTEYEIIHTIVNIAPPAALHRRPPA